MSAPPDPCCSPEQVPGPFSDANDGEPGPGHVRRTWLRFRVMSTLDVDRGGGYRWDPSEYQPIPVEEDGETGFAFARLRG